MLKYDIENEIYTIEKEIKSQQLRLKKLYTQQASRIKSIDFLRAQFSEVVKHNLPKDTGYEIVEACTEWGLDRFFSEHIEMEDHLYEALKGLDLIFIMYKDLIEQRARTMEYMLEIY